jgi:hypothetical protein
MHATWTAGGDGGSGGAIQEDGGARALMWVHVGDSRLEIIQSPDGHLAILRDGDPVRQWAWGARDVEACTRTFLRMARGGRLRADD